MVRQRCNKFLSPQARFILLGSIYILYLQSIMKPSLSLFKLLPVVVGLTAVSAQGALLVYDGLDYSDGTINGTSGFNGGTGFVSAWIGSTTNVPFSMSDGSGHSHGGAGEPGLSFSGLTTTGTVTLTRKSAPGGAEVHRTIDSTIASTMTSGTLYFSVLTRTKFYSIGNENLAFTFGTSDVFNPNNKPVTSGGEALGFAMRGSGSEIDFQALAVDDGVTSVSAVGGIATTTPTIRMIYGMIEWGVSEDTITLFSSTTNTDQSSFSQFATLTANVDESAFNTIHVAGQQVSSIDEIRFGQSLSDVGITNVPEPASAVLGSLGALLLLRRRR